MDNFRYDAPWLDITRRGLDAWGWEGDKDEEAALATCVYRWIPAAKPKLDPGIYTELAPLRKERYYHRAMMAILEDVKTYLARHDARLEVDWGANGRLIARPTFDYDDELGAAWFMFIETLLHGPNPGGYDVCGYCEHVFLPQRSTAVYCSTSCRVMAHKRRMQQ